MLGVTIDITEDAAALESRRSLDCADPAWHGRHSGPEGAGRQGHQAPLDVSPVRQGESARLDLVGSYGCGFRFAQSCHSSSSGAWGTTAGTPDPDHAQQGGQVLDATVDDRLVLGADAGDARLPKIYVIPWWAFASILVLAWTVAHRSNGRRGLAAI
jgi:hypothetical protein